MYHDVEGEGLRTSYAFAPRVTITSGVEGRVPTDIREGPTHVELEFTSSGFTSPPPQEVGITRLMFEHVVEYTWADFEFHRDLYGLGVAAFKLVEIDNSPAVTEIRATGRYIGGALRHFRVTFDDHGTYNIICERLTMSYDTAMLYD